MHAGSSGSHRQTWRGWALLRAPAWIRMASCGSAQAIPVRSRLSSRAWVPSTSSCRRRRPRNPDRAARGLVRPTPNPIEPIVGPESVILTSGAVHRRQRHCCPPGFSTARKCGDGRRHGKRGHRRDQSMASRRPGRAAHRRPIHHAADHHSVVLGVAAGPACEAYADVVSALMNANTAPLMLLPILRRTSRAWDPGPDWSNCGHSSTACCRIRSEVVRSVR